MNPKSKSILCVGICCLDIIHVCDEFPQEDSDQRSQHGRWQRGGNPSNNCTVLALMGAQCEYMGTFSDNQMFKFVIDDLLARNVSIKNCVYHKNCEVPLSSVLLSSKTGSRTIIHSNPNLPDLCFNDFEKCNLNEYKWIHFEPRSPSESRLMMKHVCKWNEQCSDVNKIVISLELEKPGKHPLDMAEYADVVFLSQVYAEEILGAADMVDAVKILRERTKKSNILVCTWGSLGAAAIDVNDKIVISPPFPPTKVIDSLGAGDTFCAAVIFALANGKPLSFAIRFGNQIAGSKVGFHGFDNIGKIYKDFYH